MIAISALLVFLLSSPSPAGDKETQDLPKGLLYRLGTPSMHEGRWVSDMAFSADAKFLAVIGFDAPRVYSTSSGKLLFERKDAKRCSSIAFMHKAPRLILGKNSGEISILEVPSGKDVRTISIPRFLQVMALAEDDNTLYWGDHPGWLRSTSIPESQTRQLMRMPLGTTSALVLSPNEKTVLSGTKYGGGSRTGVWGGHLNLINAKDGGILLSGTSTSPVRAVAYLSKERVALANVKGGWHVLNVATRKEEKRVWVFKEDSGNSTSAAISPSGRLVAWGDGKGRIWIYDYVSYKLKLNLVCGDDPIYRLRFSSDGRFLAAGASGSEVTLWDLDKAIDALNR